MNKLCFHKIGPELQNAKRTVLLLTNGTKIMFIQMKIIILNIAI